DRSVQVDVLPAGQLTVEARAEFQQGRDPAGGVQAAAGRTVDAGQRLEQGGLARAVVPDQPEGGTPRDGQADVAQRPERVVPAAALDEPLLERIPPLGGDLEL